jgi:hypothetical protein
VLKNVRVKMVLGVTISPANVTVHVDIGVRPAETLVPPGSKYESPSYDK